MTAKRKDRLSETLVDEMDSLTGLVLYRTPRRWQYAIYAGGGVLDGHLLGTPLAANETDAQAALLSLIQQWTGRTVKATWHPTQPDWWAADASYLPSGSTPR